ncbi:MAG TPA: NADH-quinone oxidoreductase subunit L [Terriglobales bacterium]|nr:NADH-quinone oxidoreductase subunit L [Terriglobales bacterium]
MARGLWLIPLLPALSSAVLLLFGSRPSRRWVSLQACLAVLASFGLSVAALARLLGAAEGAAPLSGKLFTWVASGSLSAAASLALDPLAAVMILIVTGVGFLIHVYSAGYMAGDRDYGRYFGLLNLFTFFMLVLVMASNIVLMFVGWEGVGLCSYLLIGFWFERPAAARAGMKAFIVTRVGDAAFILGLLALVAAVGGPEFARINAAAAAGRLAPGLATLVAVLLFAGAVGKSAQVPLHVWLPDAMEGPTPVSALIHAATMVTAGVYMVARLNGLYSASAAAGPLVASVGAGTAVFAASLALVQTDIKKVLAYSTISQLGYMFIGCGVGAYGAAIFHLVTHAFFKGLLFLAAGSVIHALSGEQDIRKMGGLRRRLPRTFPAFFVAALAISGIPFLSGFFSKDAILTSAYSGGHVAVWLLGLLTAVMTAFYMFRLVFLTFFGEERTDAEVRRHIHESPPVMTVPMAVLAVLSALGGLIGLPAVFGERADLLGRFLSPVLGAAKAPPAAVEWNLILVSTAATAGGLFLAYLFYLRYPGTPARLAARWPFLYRTLVGKYYVDEFYGAVFVRPLLRGSEFVYVSFDLAVIDGALNGTAAAAQAAGRGVSRLQTGRIKDYALAFLLGAVLFLGFILAWKA